MCSGRRACGVLSNANIEIEIEIEIGIEIEIEIETEIARWLLALFFCIFLPF